MGVWAAAIRYVGSGVHPQTSLRNNRDRCYTLMPTQAAPHALHAQSEHTRAPQVCRLFNMNSYHEHRLEIHHRSIHTPASSTSIGKEASATYILRPMIQPCQHSDYQSSIEPESRLS